MFHPTREPVKTPMLRSRPLLLRVLAVVALLLLLGAAVFVIYFSNAYPPSAEALQAMRSTNAVAVTDTRDQIILLPAAAPRAGLIFYPGARVQAAAYAARLKPIAEQGYAVFIIKMPLNLAVFGMNRAAPVIAAHPEIRKWAVGGHSVGGAFASAFLADRKDIQGLILYASYPAGDLSARTDLVAVSIYGSQDALATVERINNAKPTMPPQTRYVLIQGGNHSYFGDYGMQDADGIPTIPREDVARQIVAATVAAMDEVAKR